MTDRRVAWAALAAAADATDRLDALFAAEPGRAGRLSVAIDGLFFDFSKTHLTPTVEAKFAELLAASGFEGLRGKLLSGGIVNATEHRAATHTAERGSGSGPAVAAAAEAREAAKSLVNRVHAGEFGDITDVIHIGIGGSALGPALLVDALAPLGGRYRVHFVSNIDAVALERALGSCEASRTLVVVVSKSFTTIETMTNAESSRAWMAAAGVIDPLNRFVAVTTAPARALEWGVPPENTLSFADSVGGRFSLWSSAGVTAALALGWPAFEALLEGAAAMDHHFERAAIAANAPVIAAMADVYYAALKGAETRAVFPYDERLRLLVPYLQQLEMESNGKGVDSSGGAIGHATAPITWGGTGTDAQHAVFQLLHQGTHLVPAEFVMVREPGHKLGGVHHRQLLANAIAQGAALMRGRNYDEALAMVGGDSTLASAKTFPGNRPSTSILLDRLDARTIGALLAFYEHRTFTAAALLGINPFDQMGVELGKDMARIATSGTADFDPSSTALLERALGSA